MVSLWRGARGLGLGIAGGSDDAAGGDGVFVSHIAEGGAAHYDGRLGLGDRILAVRDEEVIFFIYFLVSAHAYMKCNPLFQKYTDSHI